MRVLLVSGVYPPEIGGPSAQTQQLALELQRRGQEVCVITQRHKVEPSNEASIKAQDDIHTDQGFPVIYLRPTPGHGLMSKVRRNIALYQDLMKHIGSFRPDVIQMQTASGPLAIFTGIVARRRNIPTLLKYTADMSWEIANNRRYDFSTPEKIGWKKRRKLQVLDAIQRYLFRLYDKIWATTPLFRDALLSRFALPENKVALVPNFIDLSSYEEVAATSENRNKSDDPEIVLLTVARLKPWKGIETCIAAMALLGDLPIRLRIVGDGAPEYEKHLRDAVTSQGLNDCVSFAGAVPPEKTVEEYSKADAFVLASHYEPFGIALVEAMAAGLPIVATEVGGIPSVVEKDVSALLVPPGDAAALANALRCLATDEALRRSMAQAARKRSARYGLNAGTDEMLAIYNSLPRGKRRPTKHKVKS